MRARRALIVSLVVLSVSSLPGCSPAPVAEPVPESGSCRASLGESEDGTGSALTMLLDAADSARQRDRRCGPPDGLARLCRALWLQQMLDPVVVEDRGSAGESERAAELLDWALADALEAADGAVKESLGSLLEANVAIRTAADDVTRAGAIQRRARPAIIEPLRAAEPLC